MRKISINNNKPLQFYIGYVIIILIKVKIKGEIYMITKDMTIADALEQGNKEAIAESLMAFGMHCFGCAMASGETVEQAAAVHGVDVDEMVAALNVARLK